MKIMKWEDSNTHIIIIIYYLFTEKIYISFQTQFN